MKSENKSKQIIGGTLLSYLQMGLGAIVNLIYTPVMIRLLGQSEYGLYNTVASTISMLSILSFGFNSSYIRYYSRYKKNNETKSIYQLNGLFLMIFIVIGMLGLTCGLYLTTHLELVFANGLTVAEYDIAKILMFLLTINLALSFPMSVFSNIISAHERFVFLKILNIVRTVLSPLLTLPLLLMGYGSIALVTVSVCVHVGVDLVYAIYVIVTLKQKFIFYGFEKGLILDLVKYTSFIALNIVVDQINWNIDKILLGRYRGTTSVAIYSVGYSLYQYYSMFSTAISGVFTPRIHNILQQYKDLPSKLYNELTNLFIRVGRIQFIILSLVASGVVFFGNDFIGFWAGSGYGNAYYVSLLLIIPSSIALIQNLGIEIQRAENKHQFRSIAYFLMAICNLVISIYLCQKFGEIGAAAGTALSLIVANGVIMNIYYHKKCGLNIILFWKNIISQAKGLVMPIIIGFLMNRFITFNSIAKLLLGILAYTFIYSLSMWFLGMNDSERHLFKRLTVRR